MSRDAQCAVNEERLPSKHGYTRCVRCAMWHRSRETMQETKDGWACAAPPVERNGVLVTDACSNRVLGIPGLQELKR